MSEFEFASGCTNPETFPAEALAKAAAAAIPDVGEAFVRYPGELGHLGLREVMRARARRLELIEVARQFDCIVVEDNCYGDVHFEGEKEPAFYALDDSPNQVYICSLSKILGPGVRMGYFMARPPMMTRILDRRYDGGNSLLAASILARFFRDNLWEHCARTNAALREKRDAVFGELERGVGDSCTWSRPVGGLFIWLSFPDPVDRRRLAEMAAARHVRYASGARFHVRNEDIPSLRLAFGLPSLQDIREGIPLLCECIRQLST